MLYLNDFIEAISHFPEELRDALTAIRELDLKVQNTMDKQNQRIERFFRKCPDMDPNERELLFQSLKLELEDVLEDADIKYNIAERSHEVLQKRLVQLDKEIAKFKEDLEAEDPGITAIVEGKLEAADLAEIEAAKRRQKKKKVVTRLQ